MNEPETLTLTVGANGESWYHLDGGLFPPHNRYPVATYEQLGLGDFAYMAEAWHNLGRALAGGVAALADGAAFHDVYGADASVWIEIAQLWRSAGEAAELTAAALAEASGLLEVSGLSDRTAPLVAAFLIEGAAQYLVGVGHNIANISLRLCAENESARSRLSHKKNTNKWVAEVRAGTNGRDAWIFHANAKDLADGLGSSRTGPARFTRTASRLERCRAWREMVSTRHEYFHRWRYGYSTGDEQAQKKARVFLAAAVAGAAACARAAPALYHTFLESNPTVRAGKTRGTPLQGPITTWEQFKDGSTTPERDLFDRVQFRG